jgi:glycosyltransferase involved in cell wall biosynthesis
LSKYPVKVIHNGINLDVFKHSNNSFRVNNNLKNHFIILGVASIWDRRKGLNFFLELADKLKDNEIIVLVGLTKSQLQNLPKNIIGLAKTNTVEDLVDLYSSADIFLNPTLEDNFPTTNLEALACGTPIMTFNTGGSPESIDIRTGIIISEKTSDSIYESINLYRSGERFKSTDCRERALKEFSIKDFVENILDLYYKKFFHEEVVYNE